MSRESPPAGRISSFFARVLESPPHLARIPEIHSACWSCGCGQGKVISVSTYEMAAEKQRVNSAPATKRARSRVARLAGWIVFVVTALAIFIPFYPRMPKLGLDASWEYGMNAAAAKHMSFGRQMVFTYGPYAAAMTRVYDPAVDRRMLASSAFLGLSFVLGAIFLARNSKSYLLALLLALLVVFGGTELAELSLALMLIACTLKATEGRAQAWLGSATWLHWLAALVMWSTLGLLPVVKGSLLLPYATAVAIPPLLLLHRRRFVAAVFAAVVPVASTCVLWKVADQRLRVLPHYLHCSLWLTSGYTEALSRPALIMPQLVSAGLIALFLAAVAITCFSTLRAAELSVFGRAMWILACLSCSLVIFKHGVVHGDALAGIYPSLAVLAVIAAFLHKDKYLAGALAVTIFLACVCSIMNDGELIREVHEHFGNGVTWSGRARPDVLAFCIRRAGPAYERTLVQSAWNTYKGLVAGLRLRLGRSDSLEKRYEQAKEEIRSSYPFPALQGSVDIYTSEQSLLLANDVVWDPRPVLQSYSAYTPELMRMNERHLRGAEAPDWILFDETTILDRWPSLDDGMSWPALLDNYSLVSFDGRYALLRRREAIRTASDYEPLMDKTARLGEVISLPAPNGVLFAEADLQPTLAGRLLDLFFRPPQLRIQVTLADGEQKRYRIVSRMTQTGFVISPLVETTEEFAKCMRTACGANADRKVMAMSIAPAYGGSRFWKDSYRLVVRRLIEPPSIAAAQ